VFDPELSLCESAADGLRFLVLKPPPHAEPLTVIVNWPGVAKEDG
jgi:hypothetical protein